MRPGRHRRVILHYGPRHFDYVRGAGNCTARGAGEDEEEVVLATLELVDFEKKRRSLTPACH